MDPSTYNGGSVLAMSGKKCFALATDLRFGANFQTIDTNFEKVFQMEEKLFIGLAGLATDVQTVKEKLESQVNMYKLIENRHVKPNVLLNMMGNLLYRHRFGPYFIEPIIAGFDPVTQEPFLASCDLIGCPMVKEDFVSTGTSVEQIYGISESLWQPEMEPEQLFETISQAFMNAIDRDAYSGWGVVVYLVTPEKTTRVVLKSRMD